MMFRSPLRSIWSLIAAILPPRFAVMGWDDALYYFIASAIASAAGTGLANKANNQRVEAAAEQERRERFRQAELQRQADAELQSQIGRLTPEKHAADIQQAVAARTEATAPPLAAPAPYQAATPTAPVEVKSDFDRRMEATGMKARDEAARRARLGAFGDVSMNQDVQIGRLGENLRQFQLQAAGNSSIFPFALGDATRNAGRSAARGSDIANVIGQTAALYSMGSGKKPASGVDAWAAQHGNPYGS